MRNKKFPGLILVAGAIVLAGVLFSLFADFQLTAFGVVLGIGVLAVLYMKPLWGMYLVGAVYGLSTLQFNLGSLNASYGDLLALALFAVFCLRSGWQILKGEEVLQHEEWPLWKLFSLFVIAGAFSLLNTETYQFVASVKYLLRPIIFMYLMWIVMPLHYIKTRHALETMMKVMFGAGALFALGGLFQFIFYNHTEGLRRALPFFTSTFVPMGTNHNQLAEILVGVIPFGYYFMQRAQTVMIRETLKLGTIAMAVVCFMTYSRSGWLGLAASIGVIGALEYGDIIKKKIGAVLPALLLSLLIPLGILLYLINQTSIAQGSNYNRLVLQELAIDFFMTHPLFGTGVGTFINNASQVSYYLVEFGGVIDSHSMFFKVLSETGVVGIVTFYTFIIGLVIYILKALSQARHTHYAQLLATLTASAVAVFVFENFGTSYYQAQMWLPIGLLLVGVALSNKELARKVL